MWGMGEPQPGVRELQQRGEHARNATRDFDGRPWKLPGGRIGSVTSSLHRIYGATEAASVLPSLPGARRDARYSHVSRDDRCPAAEFARFEQARPGSLSE